MKGDSPREAMFYFFSAGFAISKTDMMSQLEQGKESWVPDLQGSEEREMLRSAFTGEELLK